MIGEEIAGNRQEVGLDGLLTNFSAGGPATDNGFLTEILGKRTVAAEEMRKSSDLSGVAGENWLFAVWTWVEALVKVRRREASKRTWSPRSAVEMADRGKRGKPNAGFHAFPTAATAMLSLPRSNTNRNTAYSEVPSWIRDTIQPGTSNSQIPSLSFSRLYPHQNSEQAKSSWKLIE